MIQSNPAIINFTKVNLNNKQQVNNKFIYNRITLKGNLSDERYYNKKIDYTNELIICVYNTSIYPLNIKLNIKKIDKIIIDFNCTKNLLYFFMLINNLKPKFLYIYFNVILYISIIKSPLNNNSIFLFYNKYSCKTIFHCNELNIIIKENEENDFLSQNLKFLNTNFNYFKFKKLIFRYMYFSYPDKHYISIIKKILQPYPNIKFYTIA